MWGKKCSAVPAQGDGISTLLRSSALLCAFFALVSCGLPTAEDAATLSRLEGALYPSIDVQLKVVELDSQGNEEALVSSVQIVNGRIEWSDSLASALKSRSPDEKGVQYVLKGFIPTASSGEDYYFESPILGETVELSGATTALWLAMRYSNEGEGQRVPLSRKAWTRLLLDLERDCGECRQSAASTWEKIEGALRKSIERASEVNLSSSVLSNPPIRIAHSSPYVVGAGPFALTSSEDETLSFESVFYAPDKSTEKLLPSQWIHDGPSSSNVVFATLVAGASRYLNFQASGSNTITAQRSLGSRSASLVFQVSASDINRDPSWQGSVPVLSFQANHLGSYDLSTYTDDPDGDNLDYAILSGPNGLAIDSDGILTWNPTQSPDPDQLGTHTAQIAVSDPGGLNASLTIDLSVSADTLPSIGVTGPWSVTEGTTGTLSITTADADGDEVEVTCISGCEAALTGIPASALGIGISETVATLGSQAFEATYRPSFLQTEDAASSFPVVFRVAYSGTGLRSSVGTNAGTVTVNVTNADGRPTFSTPPTSLTVVENTSNGAQTVVAADHATGASAITYSLQNLSPTGVGCAWITINPSSGAVSASPNVPYNSAGSCSFQVRATDANGLFVDSASVTYTVTDVNRPPTASVTAFPTSTNEGVGISIPLGNKFSDPDSLDSDPRESLVYSCVANCPAGSTVSGSNFSWTPGFDRAGIYSNITVRVTDKGGQTADRTFNLTVVQTDGPVELGLASGTLTLGASDTVSINEGASGGNLNLSVSPQSGDTYTYSFSLSCSPACPTGLVSVPGTGSGASSYNITIGTPEYTWGDSGPTAAYRDYNISLAARRESDNTLETTKSFRIRVVNVNRAPTALAIHGNTSGSNYSLSIDGAVFQPNTLNLGVVDPDGSNDTYTYSFETSQLPAIGDIVGTSWSFNPVKKGCGAGSQNLNLQFDLRVSDGRGATFVRRVNLAVSNAEPGVGGPSCPY